jgi:transcriptional regulator with XRE-family HTH domain
VPDLGKKIRKERNELGLSLKQLADKVGVSTMTLQRIETGKTSPSVSVLSQIAIYLKQPIASFIQEKKPKIRILKKEEQSVIESSGRRIQVIASDGVIGDGILVNLSEVDVIDPHTEDGWSFVYVLEGKAIIEHDGTEYVIDGGDALYYDSRFPHSIKTLDKTHKVLSIFFKGKT